MPPVAAPSTYSNSSTGHTFKIDRPARISACPDVVLAENIWLGVRPTTAIRSSGVDYYLGDDRPFRYGELTNYRNSIIRVGDATRLDPGGVYFGSQDFPYRFHLRSFEDQALQHMTANSGPDLNLFAAGNIAIELPAQPRTA